MKKFLLLIAILFELVSCFSHNKDVIINKVYTTKNQDSVLFDTNIENGINLVCTNDTVLFVSNVSKDKKWVIINFSYWEKGMPRTEEVYKLFNLITKKEISPKQLGGYPLAFDDDGSDCTLILKDGEKINLIELRF